MSDELDIGEWVGCYYIYGIDDLKCIDAVGRSLYCRTAMEAHDERMDLAMARRATHCSDNWKRLVDYMNGGG